VTTSDGSQALTALAIGVALAGAPGPVQAVLLAEAVKGGVPRGLRALAGVHATFGILLLGLALGISVVAPKGVMLRILELAGGALLLWLAFDGFRSRDEEGDAPNAARALAPEIRGSLSILLNPGGWLFLAAVASPLVATATTGGGKLGAVLVALALVAGAALGDVGVVLLGGLALGRRRSPALRIVRTALALILAAFGVLLLIGGLMR
jgi:threonine/homoserine/homoserine lactone efflux protein